MTKLLTSLFSTVTFFSFSSFAGQFDFLVGVWSPAARCSSIRLGKAGENAPIVIEKRLDSTLSVKICKASSFSATKRICEVLGAGSVAQVGNSNVLVGTIAFTTGQEKTNAQVNGPLDPELQEYIQTPAAELDAQIHTSSQQMTNLILTVQTVNPQNKLTISIGNCGMAITRR